MLEIEKNATITSTLIMKTSVILIHLEIWFIF